MANGEWGFFEVALTSFCVLTLGAYWVAAYRLSSSGRRWPWWRTLCFTLGASTLIISLLPAVVSFAHHDLRGHMAQHLLIGMFAPLGLVFGAPVSLTLRSSPAGFSRWLVRFLQKPFVRIISHPVSALFLNIGGMYLLYLTPLYAQMLHSTILHALVHWHFLMAGCLFTWAIAGPDPAPHRPGAVFRLVTVFVSMATHAFLAKVMYAYGFPEGTSSSAQEIKNAAKIMYYGGDLAELFLVIALLLTGFCHQRKSDATLPGNSVTPDGGVSFVQQPNEFLTRCVRSSSNS